MKEEQIIAIDLGNGSTSWKAGNGKSGEFASLVAVYGGSSGLGGEFGKNFFKTQDGKRYLVGDDCREEGAKPRSTDSSFYGSSEMRVLFLKVLKECDIKKPLIVSGLPTEFHTKHAKEFEENLRKWAREEGYQPEAIKILPQWAGPWFDPELADEAGKRLPLDHVLEGKIGIIDIGQGTTDVGQFNNGKVSDARWGESKGVSDIHRQLYTLLKQPEKLNEMIPRKEHRLPKGFALDHQTTEFTMDTWLRAGYIPWRGMQLDIRAISQPVFEEFAADLLPRCIEKVWGSTDFLRGMILAGGGPIVLGREVFKKYVSCPILMAPEPDKSVVSGYYRYFKTQVVAKSGVV